MSSSGHCRRHHAAGKDTRLGLLYCICALDLDGTGTGKGAQSGLFTSSSLGLPTQKGVGFTRWHCCAVPLARPFRPGDRALPRSSVPLAVGSHLCREQVKVAAPSSHEVASVPQPACGHRSCDLPSFTNVNTPTVLCAPLFLCVLHMGLVFPRCVTIIPMYSVHPYASLTKLGRYVCIIHSKIWNF